MRGDKFLQLLSEERAVGNCVARLWITEGIQLQITVNMSVDVRLT